jgi:hypothetical protein
MLDLSTLDKEELIQLVKMLSGNLLTVDGLWFTQVEEELGLDAAVEMDAVVWGRFSSIEARRIRDRMGVEEEGIQGLRSALRFTSFVSAEGIECRVEEDGGKLMFTVTDCRPQRARIKSGREEFPCKGVGIKYFEGFARFFDAEMKIKCLVCPPDDHPDDVWCSWEMCSG